MVDYLDGVQIAVPDGATQSMSIVDNDLRDLKNRLINSFQLEHHLTGEHKISRGNTAARPASPLTDQIHINTQTGMIEYWDGAAWQDAITLTVGMAAGSKVWFYNNAAPTGYTFDSSLNDRVLSITSTEADGGATTGTWTIAGLTNGVTGSGGGHSHVISRVTQFAFGSGSLGAVTSVSTPTGVESAHTHPGSTITADGTWRPASARGIVCTKD